ncbi:MAG: carboxypeptidase [Pseudomonadota bacterium]
MKADLTLGHTRLIVSACMKYGLLRNQAAYVLATAYWETARTMEPVREAFWLGDEWRKANLRYYPWYGRGFVQLTWERNYHKAGAKLDLDLTTDPDKVMEPETSAAILVLGMQQGWFTGKKLDDYITLQRSNYRGARRIVNGTDKAAAIAEIAREYEESLLAEGYGIEATPPVIEDRRDGTAPRQSPAQSTTVWATVTAGASTLGQYSEPIKSTMEKVTQTFGVSPEFALTVICLCALAWVFRERLRHFASGVA